MGALPSLMGTYATLPKAIMPQVVASVWMFKYKNNSIYTYIGRSSE